MRPPIALAVATLLGVACDGEPHRLSWRIEIGSAATAAAARSITAEVIAGGCRGGDAIYRARFRPGESPEPAGLLPPGQYGLSGRALDGQCRVIASHCEEVLLPDDAGQTVVVVLQDHAQAVECGLDRCVDGVCCPPGDIACLSTGRQDGAVPDAGTGDAGLPPCVDPGDGGEVTWTPGEPLYPVFAFEEELAPGLACEPCNARFPDGLFGGVDRNFDEAPTEVIDGENVTACLGVDFGGVIMPSRIVVRARAVRDACGFACVGADCGTGAEYEVFAATRRGEWTGIGEFRDQLPSEPADHSIELGLATELRYVLLCRTGFSEKRDDVQFDAVWAVTD